MPERTDSDSRRLLRRLRDSLALPGKGQDRLDRITHLIADSMRSEVCSIYLFRDPETLELCSTEGLKPEAVHQTRLKLGEGLVGQVARMGKPLKTANAPAAKGFRYMPETGEEAYCAFLGVPIQRVGERLGVLVVQSKTERLYAEDEVDALEVVAMVLAEMAELGAFNSDEGMGGKHTHPVLLRGGTGQEGAAEGHVWLHEPRVVVTNPVADDPLTEIERIRDAVAKLRVSVDDLLSLASLDKEQRQVLEAYRMFAHSRGWLRRMEEDITRGLSAEAAVQKEQSSARARMEQVPDAYLRDRLHDLDDLANRLLRILTGQGRDTGAEMPSDPVLVARNIGPAELLDYGRKLKGIVLEEGSVGSHAAIVARALAIPLVIHADRITAEALNGDPILVDGDQGIVHLRPEETIARAFRDKMAMQAQAQERYTSLRGLPAQSKCGTVTALHMNAGLMADLPSLEHSGAEKVGLFRTELQFLIRNQMPKREELARIYTRVLEAAKGRDVTFRTLDIGSDKVLPYMKPQDEPNPAMGWRAIRVGLDKPGVLRMQLQALIRAHRDRPMSVMFPFITEGVEFREARDTLLREMERERAMGHAVPASLRIGAMLETPALAFAPDRFFRETDFISIGGNDLKQFFFAADRENERVRRRYDTLSVAFLEFLRRIVLRCEEHGTELSFCGEDAGRPIEAMCFAAMGIRTLSMRPASIGPVKTLLRRIDLAELRELIDAAMLHGDSVREPVIDWLSQQAEQG
ncbi:phosphoenolpyruvate--protein phosphotransferase [Falsirhodobacter sp. 20TX0035]|uniref:phosphoenolpyruvate--protein phosphotransferase n=1 Tax=Falsirhodobacter sp. 20TX0035 TaxID=3022019 RepID=UPI00232BCD72|nr:phosphoenolpyruvate--protein phosphotransferase [Falsirhodobacter sp. 20TX0035]MDB6455147.1 phosphoenolpyruvate--protein phosphotransferase [Falsirhodobacter sp. 20TX0035]